MSTSDSGGRPLKHYPPGSITEWEFTADAAGWINSIIENDSSLPFSRAKCEQRGSGSNKRRDITLINKNKRVVLTGEVKLPYRKDGGTPHNAKVVRDARGKARRAGAEYFFTWNVNECILWQTEPANRALFDQNYKKWHVTEVSRESHMELPSTLDDIKSWLSIFLNEFANIIRGTSPIGVRSPDEKFIEALESALRMPIRFTFEDLDVRYKRPKFKAELDQWMRDDQGWTILEDIEGVRENLERTAKFTCYALVNKLVFYEALLKRYGAKLSKLSAPEHIDSGDALRTHLEGHFAEAKKVTGDYETVFGEDHTVIGNRVPFYSDSAVPFWRELINQIHEFDFSKLDYEIIGNVFERLISPEERHKFGQFYTRVEVVDLINSFCMRRGDERVMDPACGGGTFLVRAYARKRELAPNRKHGQLLSDLFGIDVSHFATHLTTINLATRDLIDDENYPQIARDDFFNIRSQRTFLTLPRKVKPGGLGETQHRTVDVPELDAVVGNPPYIRQEEIRKSKRKGKEGPEPGTKEFYQKIVKEEAAAHLSGRSDIHCYFWPHAASFLKADGHLCLLTSSPWLDVEYGFRLQAWILRHFEILAILESVDEPWFVGARVPTAITILKRQNDLSSRTNNVVRFVQLRRPIREILAHDGTTASAIAAADGFRDEILALSYDTANDRYRARLIPQGTLWSEGVKLGLMMGKSGHLSDDDETSEGEAEVSEGLGDYYGGKWGVYLRAPDFWFELLELTGRKWSPLGEIATVRRGITSGCDDFFYVKDATTELLAQYTHSDNFERELGYPRKIFVDGEVKLVRCGKDSSELKAIESQFLEPEIHSLMEIDGYTVSAKECSRLAFLCSLPPDRLKGTYAGEYVRWGESNNWHKNKTCAARASEARPWYDLTGHRRAPALWAKERQYRHIAPANPNRLVANCRLYEIYPPEEYDDPALWGGILNSTWVLLSCLQFGRSMGNEGNWSTMVVDVNMMLTPDPRKASPLSIRRVAQAFERLESRNALQFLTERRMRRMTLKRLGRENQLEALSDITELDMEDRQELDDAVLELIGVSSRKRRRELIDRLYSDLRQFFEWTRQKEEKAITNKSVAKRRGALSPSEIASQIFGEIQQNEGRCLRHYDPDFIDRSVAFDTYEFPADGNAQFHTDMFAAGGSVRFMKGKKHLAFITTKNLAQAKLIVFLAERGIHGLVRIPRDPTECVSLMKRFGDFFESRSRRFRELIRERTADEDAQTKILHALHVLVAQGV